MKHLITSRKLSRVFSGLVLALAVVLVACGGDTDEPDLTATSVSDQMAQPTVPALDGTPDTEVSEDEIAVLPPDDPATPEAPESTPAEEEIDEAEVVESTPVSTPVDLVTASDPDETATEATQDEPDADLAAEATPPAEVPTNETTVEAPADDDEATPDIAAEDDESAEPTERARTGNETFDHPGDGTGGSGMPGERNGIAEDEGDEEVVQATPAASPIAQLSILGCDVPDVPGFIGESNTFLLTVDVNFRSGPGVDCDPVIDEPLGEGQVIEVIGGPVTQTEDGSEWVQIEIDGEPGWITTEFIEPTE